MYENYVNTCKNYTHSMFLYSFIFIISFFIPIHVSFSNESEEDIEKIQVTGSRIKRIDIEGPSPLVIFDQEDLEISEYNSIGDLLRDSTLSSFGLDRERSGSISAGESFANVHGASALILINGKQVVKDPNAESVDLNLIPIYAVQRVEIIKDGASSIYGSDALGGVINFIMKENFTGLELHSGISSMLKSFDEGFRTEVATVFGDTFSNGSITGTLQYRYNEKIFANTKKWSRDLISPISPYAVFIDKQTKNITIDSNCPVEMKTSSSCNFHYSKISTTLPRISQISTYIQGDYKKDLLSFYSQIIASYKETNYIYAPIPGALELSSSHKMSVGTGQAGTLQYRFMEAGNRDMFIQSYTLDSSFGIKGYIGASWDFDLNMKASHTLKIEKNQGLLLKDKLYELIERGIYDPFDKKKRNLKKALYTAKSNNSSNLALISFDSFGDLSSFSMALGTQALYTDFKEIADSKAKEGKILSNAGSDGQGSRYILSNYAELASNHFDSLELQIANRFDYYSDFKLTMNPKFSFRFQPNSSLLTRGSIGTSFIAPPLSMLYGTESEGFPVLIDSVACYNELKKKKEFKTLTDKHKKDDEFLKDFLIDQRKISQSKNLSQDVKQELKRLSSTLQNKEYCVPKQFYTKGGGNKNLKETKGLTGSLGFILQMSENFNIGTDAWYIQTNGSPSSGISVSAINAELKKGSKFVKSKGVVINRNSDLPYNPILRSKKNGKYGIETKLLNIASAKLSGIDFNIENIFENYSFLNGSFYFRNESTYLIYSQAEGFPEMGFKNNLGKAGLPKWRNILELGWMDEEKNIKIQAHSVASTTKATNELEQLGSYTRFDFSYHWLLNEHTNINFKWINILLSSPPLDDSIKNGQKIDTSIHEPRGTYLHLSLKRKF